MKYDLPNRQQQQQQHKKRERNIPHDFNLFIWHFNLNALRFTALLQYPEIFNEWSATNFPLNNNNEEFPAKCGNFNYLLNIEHQI